MYEYRCICICHVYVCNAQTLCLAVAGNRWKLLLIFHASPLHFFSKTCPAGTHAGILFHDLTGATESSFEGVTRWHSDKASGAFLSVQPNGIEKLFGTGLSMQRGCFCFSWHVLLPREFWRHIVCLRQPRACQHIHRKPNRVAWTACKHKHWNSNSVASTAC